MSENRISAQLSNADQTAVLAAINTIRQKLPFLLDLTPEDRRSLPRIGFVITVLGLITQAQVGVDLVLNPGAEDSHVLYGAIVVQAIKGIP